MAKGKQVFLDYERMKEVCLAPIDSFEQYGIRTETKTGPYFYKDNGADILFVAHLDSVVGSDHFFVTPLDENETIVWCATLDDRLGAYLGIDFLWRLGLKYDLLLTTGEETGRSTAKGFDLPEGKVYNWMFSFDRAGDDAVHYQYNDKEWLDALKAVGYDMKHGSYSDIASLTEIGVCGVNIGVGYQNYHDVKAWASMKDMLTNVKKLQSFCALYQQTRFPFTTKTYTYNYPRYDTEPFDLEEWRKRNGYSDRLHSVPARTGNTKIDSKWDDRDEDGAAVIRRVQQATSPLDLEFPCEACHEYGKTTKDELCIEDTGLCMKCYNIANDKPYSPDWDEFDFMETVEQDDSRYTSGFVYGDEVEVVIEKETAEKYKHIVWTHEHTGIFRSYSGKSYEWAWVRVFIEGRKGKSVDKLLPVECLYLAYLGT